jgi:DNA-binding beta-propeller fold protein YncE
LKLSNFLKTTSQTFLMVLTLTACQAWAATPLNGPLGLALDSKGNLYVANSLSNQILVYNPTYVQLTRKTITASVSDPYGVAFDSKGNLYVANYGNSSVTVYDSTEKQKTGSTITNGIQYPVKVAIDGLDDVWVGNNYDHVTMYSTSGTLIGSSNPGVPVESIATHGAWFVLGSSDHWTQYPTGEYLTKGEAASSLRFGSANIFAATFDKKGNYWVCQFTGEVDVVNPYANVATLIIPAGQPGSYGMAVDSTRNRIYLSSYSNNTIDVFTTSGAHLYTIY